MKRSIITKGNDKTHCYICGRRCRTERHHMLHGSNRKMADKYGLTVQLCHDCYRRLHDQGINDLELERIAQKTFEQAYGHDKWMSVFGKDYTA